MSWFKAFRNDYAYTSYGENRSAVTIDISLAAVIYASILVSLATLIATIGIRGKERWSTFIRVVYSLFIGAALLVSIFGHGWQTGSLYTKSFYTFVSRHKFEGIVGLKMGLSSVNITLSGSFSPHNSEVHYNERLQWFDVGQLQSEYNGCLEKGLPEPILSVASYFSYDDGGLRWGRSFKDAGYFAYVLLWTSFAFWLVTNVLLSSVVFYGSAMFLLSGITIDLAVIIYHVLQPQHVMKIPFQDGFLTLRYDWSFWLMVAAGILTTLLGLLLLLLDWVIPRKLSLFFLVDSLLEEDEDETNHNLARSPNENNLTPRKRPYLSLLDNAVTKNGLTKSQTIDRQTSTLNGDIQINIYHSAEDVRTTTNLSRAPQFLSHDCLTVDSYPHGSQRQLIENEFPQYVNSASEVSSLNSSMESLPFEQSELKHVAISIPDEIRPDPEVNSPTEEKDTHL
ncbi:dual oxidase maturation factor 1-like isoform X2 [Liolophura sinensis]